jgi:hypothetical protein
MKLPIQVLSTAIVIILSLTGCEHAQKETRLKQIDAQLANWTPTGRPEDAQKRAVLTAERAQLAADLGLAGPAPATNNATAAPQVVQQYQPAPAAYIAQESNRADNRWQPMTPNSRWMDNPNNGQVYGRTIYNRSTYRSRPNP